LNAGHAATFERDSATHHISIVNFSYRQFLKSALDGVGLAGPGGLATAFALAKVRMWL
jgi:hypothetical protein